nr:MAG: hypothetical protein DIU78_09610 [Pseudomonadota bacterium]
MVASWTNETVYTPEYSGYGLLVCKPAAHAPYTGPCLLAGYPSTATAASSCFGAQVDTEHYVLSTEAGFNDGILRLYSALRRGGSTLELRVDGRSIAAAPIPSDFDVSSPNNPVRIGGQGNRDQALRGVIGEIVMIRGESAEQDLQALEAYFVDLYGLGR